MRELSDIAMVQSSDDMRQRFFAKQAAPALLDKIFAQPRSAYRHVNAKEHPLSVALRVMSKLHGSLQVFGTILHQSSAVAFMNVVQVMAGLRPQSFRLTTYQQAINQTQIEGMFQLDDENFLPQQGELLGPIHLAHAWKDLERRYGLSLLMPSNHRQCATTLARRLHQKRKVFDRSAPLGLRDQEIVLRMGKADTDDLNEFEQQKQESMHHIANACAWFAWHCRLEARNEGALSDFHSELVLLRRLVEVQGPIVSECLAFYLYVAPAMFAYYLLLWELVITVDVDTIVQNV